jgi:hypothetical protein
MSSEMFIQTFLERDLKELGVPAPSARPRAAVMKMF